MVENGVGKVLYKIELLLIKVIPFIIMFCYALNSILYYFDIEVIFLSTFSGLSILTWIFLYISSFVFKFCVGGISVGISSISYIVPDVPHSFCFISIL